MYAAPTYGGAPPRGLGFVPLLAAAAGTGPGQQAIGGLTSFVGGLFGGGPGDEYEGWERDAMAGRITCPGPFNVQQVFEALKTAPRGTPGLVGSDSPDDPTLGTVEGARTALRVPMPIFAGYPLDLPELANALVYVAHGRKDCNLGWHEEPAATHIRALLRRHAERPQLLQAATGAVQAAGEAVGRLRSPSAAGLNVPILLAVLGAGIAMTMLGRDR